jgi:adenosylhomocysteinase
MKAMKSGVILANAGHFDNEIDKAFLEKYKKRKIRENVEEFIVGGKKLYLLADGRLVNLVAGQGHPAEIMDMSFANQALAAEFLVKNKGKLGHKVYKIPEGIDRGVARLKLKSMGIILDVLSKEQKEYMSGWEEGT